MEKYNAIDEIIDLYNNAKVYALFAADKTRAVLNHKITLKEGLTALVAGIQLMNISCASNISAISELNPKDSTDAQSQKIPDKVKKLSEEIKNSGLYTKKPIIVRLTPNSDYFMLTRDGYDIKNLAKTLGLGPNDLTNGPAEEYEPAFEKILTDMFNSLGRKYDGNRNQVLDFPEQLKIHLDK